MCTFSIISHDCPLCVYIRGQRNSNIAILFLHGGPGSGAAPIMELPTFQALQEHYCCIYFDQRGCGNSPYDLQKGLPKQWLIDDVHQVLQAIKQQTSFEHIFLWGGSFGGVLAALYLEQHAHEVDGAILSSPAMSFDRVSALAFYERMQQPYQQRMQDASALQTDKPCTPEEFFAQPQIREFIFSKHNPSNSLRHIQAMSAWFFQTHFPDFFRTITIPILLYQGKEDPICRYQELEHSVEQANNPHLFYQFFDDCGHAVFEDQCESFLSGIHTFIQEVCTC